MLSFLVIAIGAVLLFAPRSPAARKIRELGRGLMRALFAVWLAVMAGSFFLVWSVGMPGSRAVSPLFAMMVFGLIVWLARRQREADEETPAAAAEAAPHPSPAASPVERVRRASGQVPADPALAGSWRTLAVLAEGDESRVAVVRASCERYLALVQTGSWEGEISEWAAFIRRNLPALVESCAAQWRIATASERETLVAELLESLEQIGAKSDRLRERARRAAETDFDVQRAHIARQTAPDPFSDGSAPA